VHVAAPFVPGRYPGAQDLGFADGKVIVTVGISLDSASLNFGGRT